MRANISAGGDGWLYGLDPKKILIIVLLLRLILASAYDVYSTVTRNDFIVPDSKFYSMRGRYVDLMLQGYRDISRIERFLPADPWDRAVFIDAEGIGKRPLLSNINDTSIHFFVVGLIYYIFGYFTICVRVFNIMLSMGSVLLMADISSKLFGRAAACLFLILALFDPVQFIYSITLSRDFLRVFAISFILWIIYYTGELCKRTLRRLLF